MPKVGSIFSRPADDPQPDRLAPKWEMNRDWAVSTGAAETMEVIAHLLKAFVNKDCPPALPIPLHSTPNAVLTKGISAHPIFVLTVASGSHFWWPGGLFPVPQDPEDHLRGSPELPRGLGCGPSLWCSDESSYPKGLSLNVSNAFNLKPGFVE